MDQQESVRDLLKETFENVNNWLNFAEAKNAAILAFAIALLAAVGSMEYFTSQRIGFILHVLGTSICMICSLISFLPNQGKDKKREDGCSEADNLIFYQDIAKYDPKGYLKAVYKRYRGETIDERQMRKIELDFATEITVNAAITVRKYAWFKRAMWIQILDMCLLVVLAVIPVM